MAGPDGNIENKGRLGSKSELKRNVVILWGPRIKKNTDHGGKNLIGRGLGVGLGTPMLEVTNGNARRKQKDAVLFVIWW